MPNRTTIVVSTTKNFDGENCLTAKSLMEAIRLAGNKNIYISGGARLYEEALLLVEKMYITEIDCDIEGDTYFPHFEKDQFVKEINEKNMSKPRYNEFFIPILGKAKFIIIKVIYYGINLIFWNVICLNTGLHGITHAIPEIVCPCPRLRYHKSHRG